jgi:DNA primase
MHTNPHPAVQATSILEVAAALGLPLEGRRTYCINEQGHQDGRDDNPSLTFFPDSGRFKCFACGVHGDTIDLVRSVLGLPFREAVNWIRDRFGGATVSVVNRPAPAFRARTPDPAAIEAYGQLYSLSVPPSLNSPEGQYLKQQRGLNLDLAIEHGVRAVAPSWALWQLDQQLLEAAGLLSKSGNFLFARHTLLFFYFDGDQPVYVSARDVTGEAHAKELSPSGLQCPVPYNANVLATNPDTIYICEGPIDTLSAVQLGYSAIGVPGTNRFREEWFSLLRHVPHVRVLFDNDMAGQTRGAELRTQLCLHGIRAEAIHPAVGKDVNDLLLHLRSNTET